ncbi:MAG: SAM-dependent methyltransferase [Micromonosporaceae bacterium]|nr:SAM-dependent methyltransferase [Micromonosporaceae bacterium]
MSRYALLIAPSANRVYASASTRLARSELAMFGTVLSAPPTEVAEEAIGGVPYLGFTASLTERDLAYLANLSSIYVLFEVVGELLRPVPLQPRACFDDDLITIPKYAGKTNEQFTKLLLNATLLASGWDLAGRPLTVLDPLCGRGTTLNQALMYGYDAVGIELDGKDVDAYSAFLRTYLQRKRIKHRAQLNPVRRERKLVARKLEVSLGSGRQPAREHTLTVLNADTTRARELLRPGCADVLVADMPYGVAHGSHTAAGGLRRDPLELLRAAVPVWLELLRPGGAIGLSWNTHVAKRAEAVQILAGHGLSIVDGPGYLDLAHRVDQAINRDVLVARREPG